jgi:hypothetical protein
MPYVLIPEGFKLQKVTKLQKAAVDAKRRHEDFKALLNNPATPTVVGGLVASVIALRLGESIVKDLEESLGTLPQDAKDAVEKTVTQSWTKIIPGGGGGVGVGQALELSINQLERAISRVL